MLLGVISTYSSLLMYSNASSKLKTTGGANDTFIGTRCTHVGQLLGLGHNGHIGFNEPADHFPKETHCVDLQERTIEANKRFFASIDDVPRQAYTMGIGTIMRARKILIIVSGEDKADIVRDAFFGPITPTVPASILQLHPDVTLVADEAALSRLPQ